MRSPPDFVVLPHLRDVVEDVALMMFEPVIETKPALHRSFDRARARSMLQRDKEPVRRLP